MNRFCTHCYRVLATPNWNHALITPFIDPIATKTSFWMSILNLIRKKNTKTRRPNISSGSGLYLRLKHRHRMQHLWCHVLTLHQPFPISSGSKSNIFPPFCVSTAKSTLHLFEVKIEVIVIQHPTHKLSLATTVLLSEHSLQHTSGVNSTVNFKPFQLNIVKNQNAKTQPLTSFVFWETSISFWELGLSLGANSLLVFEAPGVFCLKLNSESKVTSHDFAGSK